MNPKIQCILLTTDLSDASWAALPFAAQLVRDTGARLHVGCVLHEPFDSSPLADRDAVQEAQQASTRRARSQIMARIEEEIPGSDVGIHLFHSSNAVKEIIACAREINADLITMATHGRTGLKGLLLGSTTEKVIHQAKIPVLTVPAVPMTDVWP